MASSRDQVDSSRRRQLSRSAPKRRVGSQTHAHTSALGPEGEENEEAHLHAPLRSNNLFPKRRKRERPGERRWFLTSGEWKQVRLWEWDSDDSRGGQTNIGQEEHRHHHKHQAALTLNPEISGPLRHLRLLLLVARWRRKSSVRATTTELHVSRTDPSGGSGKRPSAHDKSVRVGSWPTAAAADMIRAGKGSGRGGTLHVKVNRKQTAATREL